MLEWVRPERPLASMWERGRLHSSARVRTGPPGDIAVRWDADCTLPMTCTSIESIVRQGVRRPGGLRGVA
jgi:hypothetical protein